MLNTPVLFLIYKRPESTRQVFEQIRKIKPLKLFIVADGPRSKSEEQLCSKARNIVSEVDWNCEIKTLFREKNIGSKYSVSSGINWFFTHVDEGIILEDDCVPNESFFLFCSETLKKYRHNAQIMHITGTNLHEDANSAFTYHFSKYPNIWGWATWKRAWEKYDLELKDKEFYDKLINKKFKNPFERRHWRTVIKTLNKLDAWDYQWMFSIWKENGICVNTNYNFILNIGFNQDATHTTYDSPYPTLQLRHIEAIRHPQKIEIDKLAEIGLLKSLHSIHKSGHWNYFLMRAHNLIHKIKKKLKLI